eukprot:SAG22_NODE_17781_length_298_cov_1.060302_1_plen_83_part_10
MSPEIQYVHYFHSKLQLLTKSLELNILGADWILSWHNLSGSNVADSVDFMTENSAAWPGTKSSSVFYSCIIDRAQSLRREQTF